jgi:hypothetical protein
MSEPLQPGQPQFVLVEGDQLIYCEGRLAWYFRVHTGLYWVTRPEFFPQLPPLETLQGYRIQDRHRLWQWLAARDQGSAQLHQTPAWGTTSQHWTPYGFTPAPVEPLNRPVYDVPPILHQEPPPPPPRPPAPRYNPQYDPEVVKRHTEENEYHERVKALEVERLNKERMERETGMSVERRVRRVFFKSRYKYRRPMDEFRAGGFYGCGAGVAIFLDDHHYIQAMFEVYSQQRYRLL